MAGATQSKGEVTRGRLVQVAADLFYAHGFQAVGLDRVLDEVGITKTAFYKHFESKDDLILAALDARDGRDVAKTVAFMRERGGEDPRGQVLAVFDQLDEWFREPDFRGCLFINAATEFPSPHHPVHQAATKHGGNISQEVRVRVMAMGQPASDAADQITGQIMLLVAGAIVARHANGDMDSAKAARGVAETLLPAVKARKPRRVARRRVSA